MTTWKRLLLYFSSDGPLGPAGAGMLFVLAFVLGVFILAPILISVIGWWWRLWGATP